MTQPLRHEPSILLPGTLDTPMLHALTEVEFIKDILSTQSPLRDSSQELTGFEARILKKHLRKVIIEYNLRFRDSTKSCVGLYRESDQRLGHTLSVLETLRANGFGSESQLRVPAPIEYMPALNFLMIEKAEGKPLREVLESEENSAPYIKGAAQWLAKLHDTHIALNNVRSADDEIEASLRYTRAASLLLPRLESKIHSISRQLTTAQRELRPVAERIIHGDYHPRNIIVTPELTTVIDFEESVMGDPTFDLGYFVAQTKMTHGITGSTRAVSIRFIHEYQKKRANIESDFAQRVAIFEAQTYFQRIYHTYYLLKLKPDLDQISRWLDESETCLQDKTARYMTSEARE